MACSCSLNKRAITPLSNTVEIIETVAILLTSKKYAIEMVSIVQLSTNYSTLIFFLLSKKFDLISSHTYSFLIPYFAYNLNATVLAAWAKATKHLLMVAMLFVIDCPFTFLTFFVPLQCRSSITKSKNIGCGICIE